jgi:pimeloyl-ACP methyl ester carboxylesterase
MLLISDLGLLAGDVYEVSTAIQGASVSAQRMSASGWDGFQARAYVYKGRRIVAFRGTTVGGDIAADAALGTGMNSEYFAQGEAFVAGLGGRDLILCGHSLGGAIAQVVANRTSLPMVSFNAPGVAVLASRNIGTASAVATGIRMSGMVASAVMRPGQAWRDVRSAFNTVRGLNICLQNDVVSKIGIHYGEVMRIPGTSSNPATEHRMVTMNAVLATHAIGARAANF